MSKTTIDASRFMTACAELIAQALDGHPTIKVADVDVADLRISLDGRNVERRGFGAISIGLQRGEELHLIGRIIISTIDAEQLQQAVIEYHEPGGAPPPEWRH